MLGPASAAVSRQTTRIAVYRKTRGGFSAVIIHSEALLSHIRRYAAMNRSNCEFRSSGPLFLTIRLSLFTSSPLTREKFSFPSDANIVLLRGTLPRLQCATGFCCSDEGMSSAKSWVF